MKGAPLHEKVADLASLIMALIYVGGGVYLILSSSSFNFLPINKTQKLALAGILILYGFFRGYRVWKRRNQEEP
jgi:divalent metal cation (Fe/Co/Zn/Cd) transporter